MKDYKPIFIALYKSEADKLLRYCWMRVSGREQATDIVQEAFMKLWDTLNKHHIDGVIIENQKAMLFAIARNLIIDWYRKKKSLSLDGLMDAVEGPALQFADDRAIDIELEAEGKLLMSKLRSLDPMYQETLYLSFVEGFHPKEIAEILNVSANVISVRLDRGVKKLRELYEK